MLDYNSIYETGMEPVMLKGESMGMELRRIGKSDIHISPIGVGCWAFGNGDYWGEQNQRDVEAVVKAALDEGGFLFDTAEMYNDGASETSLGRALGNRRDEAIVCSKISPSNARPKSLRAHCEASLKRLGTDYIDIYLLHWPISSLSIKHFTDDQDVINNPPSVQGAFDTLMDLRREGKIREIGVSNFGVEQMKEVLGTGARIVINEMPYNLLSRAIEKEIQPFCVAHDISIITSMTLQQGLLAGIYERAKEVPPNQAHSRHFSQEHGKGASRHNEKGAEAEVFATVAELRKIAQELGIPMSQLSIAWAISKPQICCALVGSRTLDEFKINAAAGNITLDADVMERLDSVGEPILAKLGYNPDYYENSRNSRIR